MQYLIVTTISHDDRNNDKQKLSNYTSAHSKEHREATATFTQNGKMKA